MKIDTLQRFFSENKKVILLILFTLGMFFCFTEATFAADEDATNIGKIVIDTTNGFLKIVAALLGLLTAFVSLFLYPGWVNGTIFGLDEYLKEMWILISNVVYFIFAFILIAIAFMNIIGKGDKWELKAALPRFIVGVLIVPFSWFFVQFVLSVSAVLTVGVLTLPYDTFKDKDIFGKVESDIPICTHLQLYLSSVPDGGGASSDKKSPFGEFMKCKDGQTYTITQILSGEAGAASDGVKNSIFGITSIYTYGVLGMDGLDTITSKQLSGPDAIKAILNLGLKGIFDLLFVIMYFILMAALFLALFVRGIRLWMYAMFSPAFGLLYFFEKGKEGVGEGDNKFSIMEFISLAMVPVYVSAALSFGLVFLFVASQGIKETSNGGDENTLDLGGFKMTIFGEQGSTTRGDQETQKSTLARLIIQIFGLAMLWIAVMAALKQSETTKKIITPIADFGGSVGSLVTSAPMYAPIIPGGAGGNLSATGLKTLGGSADEYIKNKSRQTGANFAEKHNLFQSSGGIAYTSAMESASSKISNGSLELGDKVDALKDAMGKSSGIVQLAGDSKFLDSLKILGEEVKIPKSELDSVSLNDRDGVAKLVAKIENKLDNNSTFSSKARGSSLLNGKIKASDVPSYGATQFEKDLKSGVSQTSETDSKSPSKIDFSFSKTTHIDTSGTINSLKPDTVGDIASAIKKDFKSGEFRESQVRTKLSELIDGVSDEGKEITRVIKELKDTGYEFTTR